MSDFKRKPLQMPAGMGERDPKLSIWDNVTKYFKGKTPDPKPQAKAEANPNELQKVSKSFKSAF